MSSTINNIVHRFGDNKYTVIFEQGTGKLYALRHDNKEIWRDLVGDGLVLAMLQDYDFLKEQSAIADQQLTSLLSEVEYLNKSVQHLQDIIRNLPPQQED